MNKLKNVLLLKFKYITELVFRFQSTFWLDLLRN